MFDLLALAYQANMTRVFSMMIAAEVSNLTYNQIGVPDAFHPLSHHNNEQAKKDRLVKIQTYHTQLFAKFLTKLQSMPDGDGTMLDHSMILYGSNMSNSNMHNHYPLPTALVGGWKTVKGGQHLKYPGPDAACEHAAHGAGPRGCSAGSFGRQLGQILGGLRCANRLLGSSEP